MSHLDGLYRYAGTVLTWDVDGVSITVGSSPTQRVTWPLVQGARRARTDDTHVELLVRQRPGGEVTPLRVPVSSDADAARLVTTFSWRVAERGPVAAPRRRRSMRGGHR